jgi:hypothetical protein
LTVCALTRTQDEFGFAIAGAHNGTQFIDAQRNQGIREQRSEVTFVAVQPDFQFVRNPNTDVGSKTRLPSFFGSNFCSDALCFALIALGIRFPWTRWKKMWATEGFYRRPMARLFTILRDLPMT